MKAISQRWFGGPFAALLGILSINAAQPHALFASQNNIIGASNAYLTTLSPSPGLSSPIAIGLSAAAGNAATAESAVPGEAVKASLMPELSNPQGMAFSGPTCGADSSGERAIPLNPAKASPTNLPLANVEGIPEPSTWAMVAVAGALLIALPRKRRA